MLFFKRYVILLRDDGGKTMKNAISGSIIELTVNDLKECASFWDFPNKLAEPIKNGEKKAFAYKIGDSFVGGCALSVSEEACGHFSYFSVAPDFRGKGIGSRLIDFAAKYFKETDLGEMRLHVDKDNSDAIRLYERKGFVYECDATPERIAMVKTI